MKKLAQAGISLLLLAAAAYILDWGELARAVERVRPSTLAWALLATQGSFACAAARWLWLVKGTAPAPVARHLVIYYRNIFFNFFSPGNLAGDAYRVVALRTRAGSLGAMVVAVLRERVLGVISYCLGTLAFTGALVAGPTMVSAPARGYLWTSVAVVGAILVGVGAGSRVLDLIQISPLARLPRAGAVIGGLRDAIAFGGAKSFAVLIALSLAALAFWFVVVGSLAVDLDVGLPLALVGTIMIVAELIRLVPTSFQGIGIREGTYAVLFGLSGGNPEAGFILGAVAYLVLSVSLIAAGGVALVLGLWPGGAAAAPVGPSAGPKNELENGR